MNLKPAARGAHGPETMRLQLVALIDVVLFILLYFMLATSFSPEERTLTTTTVSEGARGSGRSALAPQVVYVEKLGDAAVYRIGSRTVKDAAGLAGLLALLPKENGVFVKVSGSVPVEAAAGALQAAKDAGFVKVSYVPAK